MKAKLKNYKKYMENASFYRPKFGIIDLMTKWIRGIMVIEQKLDKYK